MVHGLACAGVLVIAGAFLAPLGSGAYLGLHFRRAIFRLIMSGTLIFMCILIANASSLASPSALPPGPADGLSRAELDHYPSIKAWRPLVVDLDSTL
jgi:hypothetical protein